MNTQLPIYDTLEDLDFRALSYVGCDPNIPESTILKGPHGIPFYLEVKKATHNGAPLLDIDIAMPTLEPRRDTRRGTVGWALKHSVIIKLKLTGADLDEIPEDPEQRSRFILERMAALTGAPEFTLRNGTMEELRALVRAIVGLIDEGIDVIAAQSAEHEPVIMRHAPHGAVECDLHIARLIAAWFHPVGTLPDFAASPYVERRRGASIGYIQPFDPNGHERLEGIATVREWLAARLSDGALTEADRVRCLADLGIEASEA